ncbi:MAG TPA: hypothetical protein VF691_15060 [Cytophagaceae bacterium]|jgi:hypothetical protein
MRNYLPSHNVVFHDFPKESVPGFSFSKEDVIHEDFLKLKRHLHLKRAEMLGNSYKSKVRIMFQTANGEMKRIYTTVWAATSDYIAIKSGVSIPTKSIVSIDFDL